MIGKDIIQTDQNKTGRNEEHDVKGPNERTHHVLHHTGVPLARRWLEDTTSLEQFETRSDLL